MIKKLLLFLLHKYQWMFNQLVENKHEISLLMTQLGFKAEKQKHLKAYKVFYDEGRLIGGFNAIFNHDTPTHVEVLVYEKLHSPERSSNICKYKLILIFSHEVRDGLFKTASRVATEYLTIEQITSFMKEVKTIALSRSIVFKYSSVEKSKQAEKQA